MIRLLEKDLGRSAEFLVKNFFESKGFEFFLSEDKFDAEKDAYLVSNGERYSVEIKLETLYRKYNAFTVPINSDDNMPGIYENQLSKCANVDILIFCQRPTQADKVFRIYRAPDVGERYFKIIKNAYDQRTVALFPVDKMKLVGTITSKEVIEKYLVRKIY